MQAMQTLRKIDVMFKEGGIFQDSSEGLVTQKAIVCLKGIGKVTYYDGNREIAVSLPVPKNYKKAMEERAVIIHDVFTSFFKVNFPQHDIVNAFASLDLDLDLDWNIKSRKRLVFALATHEAMDGECLWQELTSTSSDDGGGDAAPALGLFGRAKWHLTRDCATSAAAWLKTLSSLKNGQRALVARLIRKALVIHTGTASVERWPNQIALTEMKHRANLLHIYNLESAVKLKVQSCFGLLKNHSKAIGLAMRASTSSETQNERLQAMVNAVDEVAMARNGAPSSSTVGAASSASAFLAHSKKARVDSDNGDKKAKNEKDKNEKDKKEKEKKIEKEKKEEEIEKEKKEKKENEKKEKDKKGWQGEKAEQGGGGVGGRRRPRHEKEPGACSRCGGASAKHRTGAASGCQRSTARREANICGCPWRLEQRLDLESCQCSLAAAPLRGFGVKVFLASGVPRQTDCSRFRVVSDARAADVVVVKDFAAGLYMPEALVARLYGLRVVGQEWYESKGNKGMTVCYEPAFHFHLHLWLSEAFVTHHREHCRVLKEEVRRLTGFAKAPGHLHLHGGEMPEKPPHPRLSYYCDMAASAPRVLTLEGLPNRAADLICANHE